MADNSAIRKNHLKQALQTSRSEVMRLNEAALLDIKALDSNLNLLLPFITKARLQVDENGKIYQVAPKEE